MPNYRRVKIKGGTYFFTLVTYHRRQILCLENSLETLSRVVEEVVKNHPFQVDAWVTLPDHIHCIWTLPEGDNDYSLRWALIKKEFTRHIKGFLETERTNSHSHERHREGSVWQRRFWEHLIRDNEDYNAHIDYIHFNPVKHGLVKNVADWPHSTFHRYVREGWYEEQWGSDNVIPSEGIGGE